MKKMGIWIFVLAIASGCTLSKSVSTQGDDNEILDLKKTYTAEQLRTATVTAAKVLLQRLPTEAEMDEASAGFDAYESTIRQYLNDPAFLVTMKNYHHAFFEMGGSTTITIGGAATTLNFNEPINLAVKIIRDNIDYRQIVLYKQCVGDDLNDIPCSTFNSIGDTAQRATVQSANAAGILTTQGFLQKWQGNYNFRRVSKAFSLLSCAEYPDISDSGLDVSDLGDDDGKREFANSDTSTGLTNCYSCHRNLNPRAALYFNYDINGRWTTNLNTSTPHPDGGNALISQILNEGVQPIYHGQPVSKLQDVANIVATDDKFKSCMVQRFRAFVFGKNHLEPIPDSMKSIVDSVEEKGYNVREVLAGIMTHHLFIRR